MLLSHKTFSHRSLGHPLLLSLPPLLHTSYTPVTPTHMHHISPDPNEFFLFQSFFIALCCSCSVLLPFITCFHSKLSKSHPFSKKIGGLWARGGVRPDYLSFVVHDRGKLHYIAAHPIIIDITGYRRLWKASRDIILWTIFRFYTPLKAITRRWQSSKGSEHITESK